MAMKMMGGMMMSQKSTMMGMKKGMMMGQGNMSMSMRAVGGGKMMGKGMKMKKGKMKR